jgi:hypothetical protein
MILHNLQKTRYNTITEKWGAEKLPLNSLAFSELLFGESASTVTGEEYCSPTNISSIAISI